jgi:hypothetical protein
LGHTSPKNARILLANSWNSPSCVWVSHDKSENAGYAG